MIKGILFDKDGTLIDFFSLWMGAAKAVVIQFLKENELSEEVKERVFYAMGIENGEIDPNVSLFQRIKDCFNVRCFHILCLTFRHIFSKQPLQLHPHFSAVQINLLP